MARICPTEGADEQKRSCSPLFTHSLVGQNPIKAQKRDGNRQNGAGIRLMNEHSSSRRRVQDLSLPFFKWRPGRAASGPKTLPVVKKTTRAYCPMETGEKSARGLQKTITKEALTSKSIQNIHTAPLKQQESALNLKKKSLRNHTAWKPVEPVFHYLLKSLNRLWFAMNLRSKIRMETFKSHSWIRV